MSLTRQQVRERAFQALFAVEINSEQDRNLLRITLFEHNAVDDYYNQLVEGVFAVHKELDEEYTSFLKDDWSIERIPKTSIIALRIGIYEIKKRIDIPNKVAVDQATILAETFGDSSDGRFVNGVLANFID